MDPIVESEPRPRVSCSCGLIAMINLSSLNHHSGSVPDIEDPMMDLDVDDAASAKISSPGESLTSSHAFMRYVPNCVIGVIKYRLC